MISWGQFAALAEDAFGALVAEFGLRHASSEYPFVRYENRLVRLSIYCPTSGSGEIDVGFERTAVPRGTEPLIRIDEFQRLRKTVLQEPPVYAFATSENEVREALQCLADRVRRHCSSVLEEKPKELDAIIRYRNAS